MKLGRSISELAKEVERQTTTKRDFKAVSKAISMNNDASIKLHSIDGNFNPTTNCHQQIGSRLSIPKQYYETMLVQAPELLAINVNHWLSTVEEKRLVRILDGKARAFLSDRYRPLDNHDLLEAILPKIIEAGCKIESCEITDTRMYVKAVTPRITAEIEKGDVVQAGICISNSEVGCGSIRIEPLVYRLQCLNGLIVNDMKMRKYHIGRSGGNEFDMAQEFFKDNTRKADDAAFWLKVRDICDSALNQAIFDQIVDRMRESRKRVISTEVKLENLVEVVGEKIGANENDKNSILRYLIDGKDISQYGMINAITAYSQKIDDYNRATEFERAGGDILELGQTDWNRLVSAAI